MKKELVTIFVIESDKPQGKIYQAAWGFFWPLFRSYKIISVTSKTLLKTQFFSKKNQPFQWKKSINRFFSIYRE